MEEFVVYILASEKTHKLYKGYTSNLIERFKSHNGLSKKGCVIQNVNKIEFVTKVIK